MHKKTYLNQVCVSTPHVTNTLFIIHFSISAIRFYNIHFYDAGNAVWVPRRQRTSESDFLAWEGSRHPRSDHQMLRALLAGGDDPPGPSCVFNIQGPLEAVMRRCLDILFATALAMVDLVRLAVIKRFNDKFVTMALAVPSDGSLRPPSLQEAVFVGRTVWQSVSPLFGRQHQ